MQFRLMKSVDLSKGFGFEGVILGVCDLPNVSTGYLSFSKSPLFDDSNQLIIGPTGSGCRFQVDNPRLEFSRLVNRLRVDVGFKPLVDGKIVGEGTFIEDSAIIEDGTSIGKNCYIGHNVVIKKNTIIGDNVYVKSNSVIGEKGFGFTKDDSGKNIEFPHIGGVVIGDNVEIGAINTIVAGGLGNTVIQAGTKLDDHVHVAHNCNIGSNSLITAHVEISGSCVIGNGVWVGPNSSIINGCEIASDVFVGIGTNVTKSIKDAGTYAGNPARSLKRSR